jgi:hypothetical protein
MKWLCVLAVALLGATTAGPACAADAIKIGVIYPLTGNAASAGSSAKDAVELGAEISTPHIPNCRAFRSQRPPDCPISAARKSSLST